MGLHALWRKRKRKRKRKGKGIINRRFVFCTLRQVARTPTEPMSMANLVLAPWFVTGDPSTQQLMKRLLCPQASVGDTVVRWGLTPETRRQAWSDGVRLWRLPLRCRRDRACDAACMFVADYLCTVHFSSYLTRYRPRAAIPRALRIAFPSTACRKPHPEKDGKSTQGVRCPAGEGAGGAFLCPTRKGSLELAPFLAPTHVPCAVAEAAM